jgi:hypothetical protein
MMIHIGKPQIYLSHRRTTPFCTINDFLLKVICSSLQKQASHKIEPLLNGIGFAGQSIQHRLEAFSELSHDRVFFASRGSISWYLNGPIDFDYGLEGAMHSGFVR